MKTKKFSIMTSFCLLLACTCVHAYGADTAPEQKTASQAKNATFVKAYYFHGTFRCKTCRTIEQYSREAIKQYFAPQLKSGAVVFQAINIDEPENQHFVQDYHLVSRSLVLMKYENGKQAKWKNLPAIWQHVSNKTAFFEYVKKEIEAYL